MTWPPRVAPRARIALVAVVVSSLVACVSGYERFERSRRAYEACLDAHPDDPSACEDLRIQAEEQYDDYESAAKRQWGCRQSPDRCNEPRPGQP